MSSPTLPDPPAEKRAPRKTKPLVWILAAIALALFCAMLAVALLAFRAVKNAGFAFRFDPATKTLALIGADPWRRTEAVRVWFRNGDFVIVSGEVARGLGQLGIIPPC